MADYGPIDYAQRRANLAKTRTWAAFEDAAREALAAGNEPSLLAHTLQSQREVVQDAKDTLWVHDA